MRWEGPAEGAGQGSQPEVLRVSNEQCSAPWDNNESRAVLKINNLLELSIACLYREITARRGPSVSLSLLFYPFLCCGQLLLSHTGPLKITHVQQIPTLLRVIGHLRPHGCHS